MNVLLKSMEPEYAKVRVYPKSESWPDVARFYSEEYEAVLVGKKTLREGMQEVEAQSRRFLAQRDVEVTPGHYAGVALLAFGIVVCVIRSLRRTRPGGDV